MRVHAKLRVGLTDNGTITPTLTSETCPLALLERYGIASAAAPATETWRRERLPLLCRDAVAGTLGLP